MEAPDSQPIAVPLDAGIDIGVDDRGQPRGVRQMTNLAYAAEAGITIRGSLSRLSTTADRDFVPGGLLPANGGLPESRPSYKMPLEVELVGKYATAARLVSVQSATFSGFTMSALLVRDQINTSDAVAGSVSQAYVQLNLYNATTHVLIASVRSSGWGDVSDVRITASADTSNTRSWLVTYRDPTNSVLRSRRVTALITVAPTLINIGSAVTVFTGVQAGYTMSHAVELNNTSTRWIVFAWTTSLYFAEVDVAAGTVISTTNTTFNSINYEMSSMRSPDNSNLWIATGSSSSTNIGVYKFDLPTQVVTRYSVSLSGVLFAGSRVALTARPNAPSDCTLFYELPGGSINVGVGGIFVSSISGVSATFSMDIIQGVALADAGSWVTEDALVSDHNVVVGIVGLMSAEAQDNGYRTHIVARVHQDANAANQAAPSLYASATLAHSDGGMSRRSPLSVWSRISETEIELPVTYTVRTTSDRSLLNDAGTGYDVFDRAIRRTRVKAQSRQHRGVARLGNNTYVGGSVPMSWDGKYLTPAGFPIAPHSVKVADNGVTAGAITAGTYAYRTKSIYQDTVGTLFDSPIVTVPAEQITIAATHTPVLTVYPGALWNETDVRQENAPRFTTEVYRNPNPEESGDITWRKAYSLSHFSSAGNISIVDKKTATDIAAGELLPSLTNGEVTSGPLPALSHIWAHRSRLFGIDMFDPELVWFTTEYAAPTAPRWNDALTTRVSNSGNDCIGGASLADKVVVFQEDQIAVMSGEGPDGAGNGSFSLPESLRGVGAMRGTQGAIVEMPTGVMFVHRTGIYHLGFDLALSFVGAKLTKKIGGLPPITRGVYLPSRAEVWFLTDGTFTADLGLVHALVWDVTRSRWTTVSSSLGAFSDVIDTPDGVYIQDAQGRLLEAASASQGGVDRDEAGVAVPYSIVVKMPQLRIDSGHQLRLRRVRVGGSQSEADVTLTATAETYNESRGDNESNAYAYATDLTGYGRSFQVPLRPVTQRCTAVQCTLTLTVNDDTRDNIVTLSNLEYVVSVIPGSDKVAEGKRPTVTAV